MRKLRTILLCVLLAPTGAVASPTVSEKRVVPRPFGLEALLTSVKRHLPALEAAILQRQAAQGALLEAHGAFDFRLQAQLGQAPTGAWKKRSGTLGFQQATPLHGLRLEGGYDWGDDFPTYQGSQVTSEYGRGRLSLTLPLLRGGGMDKNRLRLKQGELGIAIAEQKRKKKLLGLLSKASLAYGKWVSAYLKRNIDKRNLSLAEARSLYIQSKIESGDVARIVGVDNERMIRERRADLARSNLNFQAASIRLSLYYRKPSGKRADLLDKSTGLHFEYIEVPHSVENAVQLARSGRPEIQLLKEKIKNKKAALNFYSWEQRPKLDASLDAHQNFGTPSLYGPLPEFETKNEFQAKLSLKFEWPLQRRTARGAHAKTSAEIRALEADLRWFEDQLETAIEADYQAVIGARQIVKELRAAFKLTVQVEEAERKRWKLGDSSLLDVNLREANTAKIAKRKVEAEAVLFLAEVNLVLSTGKYLD